MLGLAAMRSALDRGAKGGGSRSECEPGRDLRHSPARLVPVRLHLLDETVGQIDRPNLEAGLAKARRAEGRQGYCSGVRSGDNGVMPGRVAARGSGQERETTSGGGTIACRFAVTSRTIRRLPRAFPGPVADLIEQ